MGKNMDKNMDKNMYRRDCGSKELIYILSGIDDRFINEANPYQNGDENREYAAKTTYFTLIF